ncbi:MAG: efflux RND transporter periplasmic adaptor subunit [Gammaproteobacteria bacterium]
MRVCVAGVAAMLLGAAELCGAQTTAFPADATGEPGFTEPRRTVELAAPELALVSAVLVAVGDRVARDQVLFELDARALEASLVVAAARRDARGEIDAAAARRALRAEQLARLAAARAGGHARADEVSRAEAELAIADAELAGARERARIAASEHARIAVEIERRRIRSPLDATVVELRHEVGEAVTPADSVLAVLAELDPLLVRLNLPLAQARALAPGTLVEGHCDGAPQRARIARVAPVVDAATGTLAIELELDNADGQLLSGMACHFVL